MFIKNRYPTIRDYKRRLIVLVPLAVALFIWVNHLLDQKLNHLIDYQLIQYNKVLWFSLLIWLSINTLLPMIYYRFSIQRFRIENNILRQLNEAQYSDQKTDGEINILKLPKIKIKWMDKKRTLLNIYIRNSVHFESKLDTLNLSPAVDGFIQELSYQSDDGDWYIYELFSTNLNVKQTFESLADYLQTFNSDPYILNLDSRTQRNLKHTLLIGATRSGKTYGLIGLLLQMMTKSIKYNLYFADSKDQDIARIGRSINKKQTATEIDDIIQMIDDQYNEMKKRMQEFNVKGQDKLGVDYRDFEFEPIILIFDEYGAFMQNLSTNKKKQQEVLSKLAQISMMGAGLGVFLFLVLQKTDSTVLPISIRDNLTLKVVLGNASNQTYMTALDRAENVPKRKFNVGEGIVKDDTMNQPKIVAFPHLKFIKEVYKDKLSLLFKDLNKEGID